jgi:uncharacterized membrane protein YozB (DUF420 family)
LTPIIDFPGIDAILNATSALLLGLGYYFIRMKRVAAHRACMISAIGSSTLFLFCYLWYHAHHGVTRFPGHGAARALYLTLLATHTVLAVAIVPLVIITLRRALMQRFDLHRRIARWTLPIWAYVSVTGVLIYWTLYHIYGAH